MTEREEHEAYRDDLDRKLDGIEAHIRVLTVCRDDAIREYNTVLDMLEKVERWLIASEVAVQV